MSSRTMRRRAAELTMLLLCANASPSFAYVSSRAYRFVPLRSERLRSITPLQTSPIKRVSSVVSKFQRSNGESMQLMSASSADDFDRQMMRTENDLLRKTVRQLELENERLKQGSSKIIIESFEGEGRGRQRIDEVAWYDSSSDFDTEVISMSSMELEEVPLWCDELDDDTCPLEPTISFLDAMRDRAYWLVGLLALQSCSGFILSRNEALLENHPVIIYFLTMLVGAGGNAGNQASVRVIRGLALGTLNERTQAQFLAREFKMACALSLILSLAGFVRAIAFATPIPETIAVTSALSMIVFISICLGAILPLFLKKLGVDPAHSSTTIQVVMDILGVVLTVVVSTAVLDSPIGQELVAKLIGSQ